jgi:hypothetical protein
MVPLTTMPVLIFYLIYLIPGFYTGWAGACLLLFTVMFFLTTLFGKRKNNALFMASFLSVFSLFCAFLIDDSCANGVNRALAYSLIAGFSVIWVCLVALSLVESKNRVISRVAKLTNALGFIYFWFMVYIELGSFWNTQC